MGTKSKRSTKFTPYKENLYFSIFEHIKQGYSPSQIATLLGMSKTNISYYIAKLKRIKAIRKIGYGVWEANKEVQLSPQTPCKVGKQHLGQICTSPPGFHHPSRMNNNKKTPKEIRGHGFVFKLKIPEIKNWAQRENFLKQKKIQFKKVGIRGSTHSILLKNHKIWLCTNSIIIYFPKDRSYFDTDAFRSKESAIYDFFQLIGYLERLLKTSLKTGSNYLFTVSRQHYAQIGNELAKFYNKSKRKLIIEQDGKYWFIIDDSFNLKEAETIHPQKADLDMDNVIKPFFNSLRNNPALINEIQEDSLETKKRLKEVSQNVLDMSIVLEQMQMLMRNWVNKEK